MTAPIASGWSEIAGWDLHPLESATLSRRTPRADLDRVVDEGRAPLRDAVGELLDLQDAYRSWLDSLPQNAAWSDTAGALRAICDLDLSDLDSVEPPRGFGRDS